MLIATNVNLNVKGKRWKGWLWASCCYTVKMMKMEIKSTCTCKKGFIPFYKWKKETIPCWLCISNFLKLKVNLSLRVAKFTQHLKCKLLLCIKVKKAAMHSGALKHWRVRVQSHPVSTHFHSPFKSLSLPLCCSRLLFQELSAFAINCFFFLYFFYISTIIFWNAHMT